MNIVYKNKPGKFEVRTTVNKPQSSRLLVTSQQARAALLHRWVWRWAECIPCPHPRLGSKRGSMKGNALCWTGFDSGVFPEWCLTVVAVQSLNCVWLFVTPWTAAHQASPSLTNSWSLLKLMSIELVMPFNHLIHPLSSPSPPIFNISQHQGLFQWVSSSHEVAKGLEFPLQHQSFQWIFRTDFL